MGRGSVKKTIGVRGPVVVQLLRLRFKKAAADFPAVSFTFVCLNCSNDCSRNDKAAAALLRPGSGCIVKSIFEGWMQLHC